MNHLSHLSRVSGGQTKHNVRQQYGNSRNDVRLLDDSADLVQHCLADRHLLPDHGIVLVVGVVGIPQLAGAGELELHELVAELTLVAHTVLHTQTRTQTCRHS